MMRPPIKQVFNVRRGWPASPRDFQRARVVGLGRRAQRSSSFVVNNGLSFQRRLTTCFDRNTRWFVFPELEVSYLGRDGKEHSCFLDIALMDPLRGYIVVVEAKRTHTPDSYAQIWFYMSVLQSRFGASWKVFGVEACSLAGRAVEYPGDCVWAYGGSLDLQSIEWDGVGAPKVGILPCYLTYDWSLYYGENNASNACLQSSVGRLAFEF
ncbi:MAG: putative endonuclease I [Siphoviridae sp. ct7UA22]|nr:MAG: putative endonuclease I [Siphoviridae sp. ct7UA22]